MARIHSFEPIADESAEILILGSMPGQASLLAGEYYAHAQNAFWRILAELGLLDRTARYDERVRALKSARIAVWDVLRSCTREGSLDSTIERDGQIPNDFQTFFRAHPRISRVFFNGAKAEACFKRLVARGIDNDRILYARLPSTSPAHASLPFAKKLGAWRAITETRR